MNNAQNAGESTWDRVNLDENLCLAFCSSAFVKLYFEDPEVCVFFVDDLTEVSLSRSPSLNANKVRGKCRNLIFDPSRFLCNNNK